MADDAEGPVTPKASDPNDQPAPKPKSGRQLIGLVGLPQWFREKPPGTPFTQEERLALKEWFAQQLGNWPLKPGDFRPPSEET
jgi:hypothetical protein